MDLLIVGRQNHIRWPAFPWKNGTNKSIPYTV